MHRTSPLLLFLTETMKRIHISPKLRESAENLPLHGVRYSFKQEVPVLLRLVWSALVVASVTYCLVLIKNAVDVWEDNPVEIVTDSLGVPLGRIPFPAVTVCPRIPHDRWAFVRLLLDRIDYPCETSAELCANEEMVREDFGDVMEAVVKHIAEKVDGKVARMSISPDPDFQTRMEAFIARETEQDASFQAEFEKRVEDSIFLRRKHEVLLDKGIPDLINHITSLDINATAPNIRTDSSRKMAIKAAFYLQGVPPISRFGSFLSFIIPQMIGRTFRESVAPNPEEAFEIQIEGYKMSPLEYSLLSSFEDLLNRALNVSVPTNISLFEIPAMLQKTYVHPQQALFGSTEQSFEYSSLRASDPDWFLTPNYFGQKLSSFRSLAILVMLASTLGEDAVPSKLVPPIKYKLKESTLSYSAKNYYDPFHYLIPLAAFCENCYGDHVEREKQVVNFYPVITEEGLCYTFNGALPRETYRRSSSWIVQLLNEESPPTRFPDDMIRHKMVMALDAGRTTKPRLSSEKFKVFLSDRHNLVRTRGRGIDIDTGYHHRIKMYVTQQVADEDIRDVPVDKRQCRFLDEILEGRTTLGYYTKSNCMLECLGLLWRKQYSCANWDDPNGDRESFPLCNGFQRGKQDGMVINKTELAWCESECPDDCEEIQYEVGVDTKPFEETECDQTSTYGAKDLLSWTMAKTGRLAWVPFANVYHQLASTEDYSINLSVPIHMASQGHFSEHHAVDLCLKMAKNDFAGVLLEFARSTAKRMRLQRGATFEEKLASIGKYQYMYVQHVH